jgi:hypothetical protein
MQNQGCRPVRRHSPDTSACLQTPQEETEKKKYDKHQQHLIYKLQSCQHWMPAVMAVQSWRITFPAGAASWHQQC